MRIGKVIIIATAALDHAGRSQRSDEQTSESQANERSSSSHEEPSRVGEDRVKPDFGRAQSTLPLPETFPLEEFAGRREDGKGILAANFTPAPAPYPTAS
jgi:hypothetical protein